MRTGTRPKLRFLASLRFRGLSWLAHPPHLAQSMDFGHLRRRSVCDAFVRYWDPNAADIDQC
jgi:hypothetical protein